MRRAGASRLRALTCACLLLSASGCGRSRSAGGDGLTFEQLADTTGLSQGPALVDSVAVERMDGGAFRLHGRVKLPDGARVRVEFHGAGRAGALLATQCVVQDGGIETPPLMPSSGPLPPGTYRVELSARFGPGEQPAEVLRSTDAGRALRGPGMTRTRTGEPMFWMSQETTR
jgi:hypothetical protein